MTSTTKVKTENKKVTGGDFLNLGLYAFAGLGMEVLYAYLLEPAVYGVTMESFSTAQKISHWILTCATWGLFALVLIKKSEKKYGFPLFGKGKPVNPARWCLCLALIAIALTADLISWGGFKIYLEFLKTGPLLFVFQYLYYAFETMLFLLIIIFGQRALELWTGKANIPYGGIICGLTWGLAHAFTKDPLTGILGLVLGFGMGSVYLLVNKNLKKAYVLLFLMFIV